MFAEDVYEDDILQSGDPIFRQLNNSFNVRFSYELSSTQPVSIQGTYRLLVEISEASGWKRTLEIIPLSLIVENTFMSEGILDLSDVQALTDNFEEQTGIFNNRYTLTIKPEVIIQGKIGSRDFSDTFSPKLPFSFDDQKMILIEDSTESLDVLNQIQHSVVLGFRSKPNTISILGIVFNMLLLRLISIYGLFISAVMFGWIYRKQKLSKVALNPEDDKTHQSSEND